jgi:ABC-2 type transport system permease protein
VNALVVLTSWSGRRIISRLKFWTLVFRLVFDWVTALYILVPGAAAAVWGMHKYYTMPLPAPQDHWILGLPFSTGVLALLSLALLALHVSWYGDMSLPLESGDRLFVLLSPLRRSWLWMSLWMERWLFHLLAVFILWTLSIPLVRACHVPAGAWAGGLVVFAGYEAAVRLASQWMNARDRLTWKRWLLYHAGRYLSYLPVALTLRLVFGGWPWLTDLLFAGFTILVMAISMRYALRTEWDAFFQARPHTLLAQLLPKDLDTSAQVQFRMRRISAAVVRWVERLMGRRLHPVAWLLLIRMLRRKGTFRDFVMLSVVAVTSMTVAPLLWVKLVCLGFCGFMFYQWWEISIRPQAETAIQSQGFVDPWTLRVAANRCRTGVLAGLCGFWILVWAARSLSG